LSPQEIHKELDFASCGFGWARGRRVAWYWALKKATYPGEYIQVAQSEIAAIVHHPKTSGYGSVFPVCNNRIVLFDVGINLSKILLKRGKSLHSLLS
jgi:hypothetical protein